MSLNPGSPDWKQSAAIEAEAAFLRGIRSWRRHPWRRCLPDPPARWHEATARLLDFGCSGNGVGPGPREGGPGRGGPSEGGDPVVLFVPSLINRWTILDLMPGHSMMRWLSARGVRPMLLDWGQPEPAFTLTDHIAGRLVRAMEAAAELAGGRKPVLAGYCMGGTFAVAAAALRPDLVSGLALLAAPWDFHAGGIGRLHTLTLARAVLEPMLRHMETVPVDMLQTLFALDDPTAVAEKFRQFSYLDPDSVAARLFVAVEDWLNDGVPLSGTTARECMRDWYGDNLPMRGAWRVAGLAIDPGRIEVPAFVAVPRRDRLVPPESARAIAGQLREATLVEPDSGHVGMTAGRTAPTALWEPLRDWLRVIGRDAGKQKKPARSARTPPAQARPPRRKATRRSAALGPE